MTEPQNHLEQEKDADCRTYTLTGDHYQMGRQWARAVSGEEPPSMRAEEATAVKQMLGLTVEESAALGTGDPGAGGEPEALTPSQLSFAQDCLEVVCNYHPPLLDEFEGYAEGLGVPLHSLIEMLSFGMEGPPGHCSAFAWRGPDGMIVGRNCDFFHWATTRHLIHAKPDIYYATVGINDGLLGGRRDGVNERGLVVALANVTTKRPASVRPRVVFHLVPRILLETCATAREAVMLTRDMPHLLSYAFLIADPQEMFVVEVYPESVRVRESQGDFVATTNHFIHPEVKGFMQSPIQENSERRLASITAQLKEAEGARDPWETAKGILTDHDAPTCAHTDGIATLWSMLANLSSQEVAYSMGAPCRNEYQPVPWPGATPETAKREQK